MPTIIEVNLTTGLQTEREMTQEELDALPVPTEAPEPVPVLDPIEKLRIFLLENPDVAQVLNGS